jgi:signal transduction histidine kinase
VARALSLRIERLERAARKVAAGDFSDRIEPDSDDELGQLGAAFDDMSRQLQRLDHARKQFIAQASHELRTPLFSLGGFIELLQDEELDEPTRREFLETMADQVQRLTKLAEDLLDLSKLDAGRLHVDAEPFDLASIATSAVHEFAGVARSSEHRLTLDPNGSAQARGDEQRALQIVRILLDNALSHTPRGTRIRVAAGGRNGKAIVEVADEGPGIPVEDQRALFERFYRGRSTKASGSGLGLAIARELAELMNGRIELESDPGRTVLTLVLPADREPDDRAAAPPFSRENAGRSKNGS